MNPDWNELQEEILSLLLEGKENEAVAWAGQLLEQGVDPVELFQRCITPALQEIGDRFERLEIFIPQLTLSGKIVQRVSEEVIEPALEASNREQESQGKVLLATVKGDLHDIGKTMVALMLSVNGFDIIDLGIDVPPAEIVDRAEQDHVDIIGMSALLTTTLPYMRDTMEYLEGMDLREKYLVIIGGAATTSDYATQIGADGHGANATAAVKLCQTLMAGMRA